MKKIMIAAALAAIGFGAFGADCGPGETTKNYGSAWAYKWKFTGKTTEGKAAGKVTYTSNWCGPTNVSSGCAFYRVKASLKIQGYTFFCSPGCGSDSFEAFQCPFEVFWQTKPHKASIYGGIGWPVPVSDMSNNLQMEYLSHIIGKNKKQYEVAGMTRFLLCEASDSTHATYALTYAGLGKYSTKYSRVTSASGNFAGTLSSCWAYDLKKDWCDKAGFWDCKTLQLTGCGTPTVAYGKWSVKYNKSAAKKFLNNQAYRGKVPAWVTTDDNKNDHSKVNHN